MRKLLVFGWYGLQRFCAIGLTRDSSLILLDAWLQLLESLGKNILNSVNIDKNVVWRDWAKKKKIHALKSLDLTQIV